MLHYRMSDAVGLTKFILKGKTKEQLIELIQRNGSPLPKRNKPDIIELLEKHNIPHNPKDNLVTLKNLAKSRGISVTLNVEDYVEYIIENNIVENKEDFIKKESRKADRELLDAEDEFEDLLDPIVIGNLLINITDPSITRHLEFGNVLRSVLRRDFSLPPKSILLSNPDEGILFYVSERDMERIISKIVEDSTNPNNRQIIDNIPGNDLLEKWDELAQMKNDADNLRRKVKISKDIPRKIDEIRDQIRDVIPITYDEEKLEREVKRLTEVELEFDKRNNLNDIDEYKEFDDLTLRNEKVRKTIGKELKEMYQNAIKLELSGAQVKITYLEWTDRKHIKTKEQKDKGITLIKSSDEELDNSAVEKFFSHSLTKIMKNHGWNNGIVVWSGGNEYEDVSLVNPNNLKENIMLFDTKVNKSGGGANLISVTKSREKFKKDLFYIYYSYDPSKDYDLRITKNPPNNGMIIRLTRELDMDKISFEQALNQIQATKTAMLSKKLKSKEEFEYLVNKRASIMNITTKVNKTVIDYASAIDAIFNLFTKIFFGGS
jgi:hypothetical protein